MRKQIMISLFGCYLASLVGLYVCGANDEFVADVGIVYGNKVELNGQPSKRLQARLNAAVELYSDQTIKQIIVSGGIGVEGFDEAKVMKDYLVAQGVSAQDILVDSQGNNSHFTAINAKKLIGLNLSVVAISQRYHVPRAKLSLRNSGFNEVYGYAPTYYELRNIYSYHREIPALLKYWIKGL